MKRILAFLFSLIFIVSVTTVAVGLVANTQYQGNAMSEGQKIVVMKIPGEDVNVLHTLIHEMSHARLEHRYREDLPRGLAESEAELSTYLVGAHFGFDFREDSAAYIKGWLDDAKKSGKGLICKFCRPIIYGNFIWLYGSGTNLILHEGYRINSFTDHNPEQRLQRDAFVERRKRRYGR